MFKTAALPTVFSFAVLAGTPHREAQTLDPITPRSALNGSRSHNQGWGGAARVAQRRDGPPTPSRRKQISARSICTACVLTLAASTAAAETKTIAKAGNWVAFGGGTGRTGPSAESVPAIQRTAPIGACSWSSGGAAART